MIDSHVLGGRGTASAIVLALATGCAGGSGEGTANDEGGDAMAEEEHGNGDHAHTNRLVEEKSPYLLQHAHNPVDWYPWGEEALSASREQNKPIFLSIGYSTCHWCHVMEHESFENEEIAALMNDLFINIKVDREERPDLDNLYMGAVQAMTGRGGWPMSVFLTPDLEPFFAGTYFPPDDGLGRPGFRTLIVQIGTTWESERAKVLEYGVQVREALAKQAEHVLEGAGSAELTTEILDGAFADLSRRYDAQKGGFGSQPKFPMPHYSRFLLRYANRTGKAAAKEMALHTLDEMAMGGMHDHLAGGFHRYSTDRNWLVPHFEKMLYDQAGLALAYTDAWLVTGEPRHRAIAEGILEYVMGYLTDEEGGFHSAEDADSEGAEGTFYVWSLSEIEEVLGDRAQAFIAAYGVTEHGNWEETNILNLSTLAPVLDGALAEDRATLLSRRDTRIRPHLDDKVITGWNGYMIEAFAHAGRAFGEDRYLEAAARAAEFIEDRLWRKGRLLRHYRKGPADVPAYLEDYGFYGRALVALYESTFDPKWIERARKVAAGMVDLFDHGDGVFAFYGKDQEQLLTPIVESHDGAMPSGASAGAYFLLRLGHLIADRGIESRGYAVLEAYSGSASRAPTALLELLNALDFSLGPIREVVIAGERSDPTLQKMWSVVRGAYMPNTVVAYRPAGDAKAITSLIPYLEAQVAIGGKPTAYVCESYACKLPVHDRDALIVQLGLD